MAIECYKSDCVKHIKIEPFCYEEECIHTVRRELMGSSYAECAAVQEKGLMSPTFKILENMATKLTEEQLAIMALVVDNCTEAYDDRIHNYIKVVELAQTLMPTGTIRSKQILVTLAVQAGLQ